MFFTSAQGKRTIRPYNRENVLHYAHKWAYARNPMYYDFEKLGGDCTNFASQCIYAGSDIMNYSPVYGWYYANLNKRTASWTGVDYLYDFLINNKEIGPFAEVVEASGAEPGDIVQISFSESKRFEHSPVIVQVSDQKNKDGILVAAHTFDTDYYRLMDFEPAYIRFLHIAGVRT